MYNASTAFHTAVKRGEPQKAMLRFSGRVFTDEDIDVDVGIEFDDNFNMEDDIAIGQTPSNEIRFTLFNDDRSLNDFTFGEFTALIGVRIGREAASGSGENYNESTRILTVTGGGFRETYEFVPLGIFNADRPNVPDQIRIDMTCYDRMQKFDQDMPDSGQLGIRYPVTLGELFAAMCQYAGVPYRTSTFINSTATVEKEPEEFENATMRTVLGWIAEAAGSNCRIDRDGYCVMAWFRNTSQSYDEHDYTEFQPYWYTTEQIGQLYNRTTVNGLDFVYGSGTPYLIQDNPFLKGFNADLRSDKIRALKTERMAKEDRKVAYCKKKDGSINYEKLCYIGDVEEKWLEESERYDALHPDEDPA